MRGLMPHLEALVQEFSERARFAFVYIAEAHAADVWPISSARYSHDGKPVQVTTPGSDLARCKLASDFARDYKVSSRWSIFVDTVEAGNPFEKAYAPWPLRFYILVRDTNGVVRVAFKAQPKNASYDLSQVRDFLMHLE